MAIFNVESVKNAPLNSVADEGTYLVTIAKASLGESKQKKTPAVDLDYEIVAGPEQKDGRIIEGKHIFQHIYFPAGKDNGISERTLKQLCKAAKVELDGDENDIMESLNGAELKIVVKHRMYNGEAQEDIKSYKAVD